MNRIQSLIRIRCIIISPVVLLLLTILGGITSSCEINDPIAEIADPGFIAAGIYWDIPVTNVTAGEEVDFYAEYWSLEKSIDYLGVWYNVEKSLKYALTYPVNGYTFTLDSTVLAREFLEIKTFPHSQTNYVPGKKAFVLTGSFPVSYTLSSLDYTNPSTFNAEQFNQLIPVQVQEQFISNLFPQLTYQNLRNLLVVNRQVVEEETFENYFDTIVEGETEVRIMKAEAEEPLRTLIGTLPFGDLIYNTNRQFYAVEISQGYQLNARLRIVNGNQVENFSEEKVITVQ